MFCCPLKMLCTGSEQWCIFNWETAGSSGVWNHLLPHTRPPSSCSFCGFFLSSQQEPWYLVVSVMDHCCPHDTCGGYWLVARVIRKWTAREALLSFCADCYHCHWINPLKISKSYFPNITLTNHLMYCGTRNNFLVVLVIKSHLSHFPPLGEVLHAFYDLSHRAMSILRCIEEFHHFLPHRLVDTIPCLSFLFFIASSCNVVTFADCAVLWSVIFVWNLRECISLSLDQIDW